jgi:hypothetical protein
MKLTQDQIKSGLIDERYRWRDGYIVHPDRAFSKNTFYISKRKNIDIF